MSRYSPVMLALGTAVAALSHSGAALAQTAEVQPAAAPSIPLNQIVPVQLGGGESQSSREFGITLGRGQSVIIDLVPREPARVRTRTFGRPVPRTSTDTSLSPASLEILDATGAVVRRKSSTDIRSSTARADGIERSIGDSGARVAFHPLVEGVYRIKVSYGGPEPLAFELLARERPVPAPNPVVPIAFGTDRELDLAEEQKAIFSIETTQPNQLVIATMRSPGLGSHLELRDALGMEGKLLGQDDQDAEEEEEKAEVSQMFTTPGRYTIIASGGVGKHMFNVRTYVPPRLAPVPLQIGKAVTASFPGRERGILMGSVRGGYHLYSLDGQAGQVVAVSMSSTDSGLDPRLQGTVAAIATDATSSAQDEFAVIAENDDALQQGLNAAIRVRFQQKGRILIRAVASGNVEPKGEYVIEATEVTPAPRPR
jgi:hypothetical protein